MQALEIFIVSKVNLHISGPYLFKNTMIIFIHKIMGICCLNDNLQNIFFKDCQLLSVEPHQIRVYDLKYLQQFRAFNRQLMHLC